MTHTTSGNTSYTSIGGRILVMCVAVVTMSANSHAQLFYDFIQAGTGDVLATLELSSLPATHTEVVGLNFTPTGEAFLGYPSPYGGVFTSTLNSFMSDGSGGLDGQSSILDFSPSDSLLHPESGTISVSLTVQSIPGADSIGMVPLDIWSDPIKFAAGDWRLVPEPGSLSLILTAVLCGAGLGRRRKPQEGQ